MTEADALAAAAGDRARAGDAIAAEAAARQALAIDPDHPLGHRYLAVARLQQGDPTGARIAAARAVALTPRDAAAHEIHGAVLVALGSFAIARATFTCAATLAPARAEPCLNVGLIAEAQGDLDGAVAAYREAAVRVPRFRPALLGLARVLHSLDRRDEAADAWRAVLAIDPDDPSALHLIAALEGAVAAAPPPGFVARTFDAYAARFDQHLVEHLGYRGPEVMRAAIDAATPSDARFARALDLGCGTGLSGAALRERCDHLAGVDLSPRMLEVAARRGVYDQLTVGDVVAHVRAPGPPLDLIVAVDVLGYLGDLAPLFAALVPRLAPDGIFAFTVERGDGAHYRLEASGRWSHGAAYIEALAAAHGLAVRTVAEAPLRNEHGGPAIGLVYVLAVTATAAESRGSGSRDDRG